MMKKYKYIYIILLLFLITLPTCKEEVLDLEPLDRITGIWEDESLAEAYVNSKYNSLQHGYSSCGWGAFTDELHEVNEHGTWDIQKGNLTADNVEEGRGPSPTFNLWPMAYESIRDINEFFQKIENAQFSESVKQRMKGEMKFIRAFLYAKLIWRYGGVPLIADLFELGGDYFDVSRASYGQCVDFVVSELDEAIDLLPPQSEIEKGKATPHAAMALKSQVLLYAASPLNNPDDDLDKWREASKAAEALFDKGYALYDDYRDLFLIDNNEIIFARYFTKTNNHSIASVSGVSGYNGGGGNAPTQNLVMDYEMINGELPYHIENGERVVNPASGYDPSNPYANRDPRFELSILHDGSQWKGREVETFIGGEDSPQSSNHPWNASMTSYNLKKFVNPEVPSNLRADEKSTNPWIFFRYGEILLNYAEAQYHLGNEDVAREYVNKIRDRVNMPPITATGEELRDKIRHERRIELAFEHHRYFDVRRWKILDEVMEKDIIGMRINKQDDGSKTYEIKSIFERNFDERLYRLPIPRTEIEKSKGALEQNSGYIQ